MKITSPEFQNNQLMPAKFTCDGENINPALNIAGIPDGTKSLALIMDDPDAVSGTFVHWVVFNISVTSKIAENSVPGKQGNNSVGMKKYQSPCPPSGTHRYFFKVYALDTILNLNEGITKARLEQEMAGHILDKAELIGLYKRR
ncbi:MAG: YbhB/YbcL family Raf kinase inhibitor-like protein [Candidatus Ratteibacteria bacterium]|nr:YbhB/YbcL family Raf kinase inhibitor-like protein [Candidatus Ratteibacteria bacterium]